MITGILVALPEELHTLTKTKIKQGECITVAKNTIVILSGSGFDNARVAAQILIDQGATQLISWGCAGALAPHLKAGDLIIPELIHTQDNSLIATHTEWSKQIVELLKNSIKYYTGTLLESHTVVALAHDKNALYQTTLALAVDMESGAVARTAQQAQIPFIALRSIVDPANLDLPHAINHAMTASGLVSVPKLMLYLCSHPSELPRLIKLGLNFNAASKTLKHIAHQLPHISKNQ
ncbi:MAG: phosphorylase [Methylococcaceae bacterium]|nr:phosphorylase [Methylococcaceae bacterium]